MIKIIKHFIYFALTPFYLIIDLCLFKKATIQKKSLLILRLDGIGDYILFRNFIELIKNDPVYKDYSITLCAANSINSLVKTLDSDYIDQFIALDRKKFCFNLKYRYLKLQELNKQGYEVILQSVYSKDFFVEDSIVKNIHAHKKMGPDSDSTNSLAFLIQFSRKYYTDILLSDKKIIFEYSRNKELIENFLQKKLNCTAPTIDINKIKSHLDLPENFIVFFTGGSKKYKKWDLNKYQKIIEYLLAKTSFDIILCGGPLDQIDNSHLQSAINHPRLQNLTGKTSLSDMIWILNKARLTISNESNAPHIATCLQKPTLVIAQGLHIVRFSPYPAHMAPLYRVIYPAPLDGAELTQKIAQDHAVTSKLDIQTIDVARVIQELDLILASL